MKHLAYTLLYMAAFAAPAVAQTNDTLRVVESGASRVGDDVIIDMKLDLSDIEVGRNRTLVYRPLLMQGDSVAELPPIIVNGRVRHIQYQRLERAEDFPNEIEIRRENGEEQMLDYHARVPATFAAAAGSLCKTTARRSSLSIWCANRLSRPSFILRRKLR